jgi:hypothetical protein
MIKRLRCLLRRHQWHSEFDHAQQQVHWKCQRCGADKVKLLDANVNAGDYYTPPGGGAAP